MYGRTKYDHDCGSMMFVKPRQVIEMKNLHLDEDGFLMYIHEDFLNGHILHNEIKKYHYFDYEINEALHLSPKEEVTIWDLYRKIENEYNNNQDEFSREIILANVGTMLKYAQRFYKRQFINRTEISGKTVSKFVEEMDQYLANGSFKYKRTSFRSVYGRTTEYFFGIFNRCFKTGKWKNGVGTYSHLSDIRSKKPPEI